MVRSTALLASFVGFAVLAAGACDDSSSNVEPFDAGFDSRITPPPITDGATFDAPHDASVPDVAVDADAASPPMPPKTNLEVWLRSDLGVTLTAGRVSTWADQSGKGHDFTQPEPTRQPVLETNDAGAVTGLAFTGVEHLVADATVLFPTSSSPLAVAVVFTTTAPDAQKFLFNYGSGDGNNSNTELGYATGDQAAGNLGLHRGSSNGTTTAAGHVVAGTVYRSVISIAGAGNAPDNVTVRTGGVDQPVHAGGGGWLSAGAYITTASPMEVGGRVDGNFVAATYAAHLAAVGDAHHVGTIAEILVYKGGLATGDLALLEAYLTTR